MDDRRVGLIIRALRRRHGWRQVDLGAASHVSQTTISALERGHLDTLTVRTFRQVMAALEARAELEIRWRGGQLDRTLDEDHAQLVARVVDMLQRLGWKWAVEVTYSVFGDRGSIDVLGFRPQTGSLLVIEVKTELTSIEATLRRLDEKVRLGPQIAAERFGWFAATTSQVLVIAEGRTARNRALRHAGVLGGALPAENVAVRRWLTRPAGVIRGRWFLPITDPRAAIPGNGGRERIRARVSSASRTAPRSGQAATNAKRRLVLAEQHRDR
jgi:transcriptional regulator with XRE-family HTH domain